ncbi:MAG: carboxypeptidase regulatory-like domain-containing protein [Planctomycetota bacterium]|jgi:protocatechuate 3,4-dioxygenase beta subunit
MKPMHLAVFGAVLAVAAVLFLMLRETGDGRHRDRSGTDRAAAGRTTPGEQDGEDHPDAREGAQGAGALSFKLKVVLPDGSAAAGAELELSGRAARRDTAATDGTIEIDGLFPGFYNLLVRRGNAVGALDFQLEKTTDLGTLELREAVAIRGHVYEPQGTPLADARVEAVIKTARGGFNLTGIVRAITTPEQIAAGTATDAEGAYELLVPTGGTYAVSASAKGFAQEAEAARPYTADVSGLDFYLFPGVQVAGKVIETSGAPIAGALVMLVDPMSAFGGTTPKVETVTAGDGTFALVAMPSRNLLLAVRALGYATHMESNLSLPALNLTIQLEAGVSVRLKAVDADQPAMPAPDVSVAAMYRGGFAAGTTDERGELLLENLPTKGSRMWGSQQQVVLWGGGYIVRMVQIAAREPVDGILDVGDVPMTKGGVVSGKVLDKVTGDPVEGARLRSMGGLDPQLEFMSAVSAASAKDGSYELRGVPLKAHTILASHPDYVSDMDPMALVQSMQGGGATPLFAEGRKKAEHNLELTPAVSATGIVLAPDGNPVAGAKVAVRDDMAIFRRMLGGSAPATVTDAEGRFTLGGLKKGQAVQITATHRDYGSSESKPARAGEPLTLTLTAPLLLKGTVVDESGDPVSGVRVTVERAKASSGSRNIVPTLEEGGGAARPGVTDKEGGYVVRNAPPGELKVTFDHRGYATETRPINVAPGTVERDLGKTVLLRGLGLEGVVVDEKGQPAPGVSIHANWNYQSGARAGAGTPGRTNGSATTDEKGRFSIYGLKAGKYRLRIWQPGVYSSNPVAQTGTTDIRVVLMEAGQLTGRVMSLGAPVSGAHVTAQVGTTNPDGHTNWDHVGWARTDGDGVFRLDSLPPDTAFKLQIRHDAHRRLEVEGVRASDRQETYILDKGIQIGGIVVNLEGEPVAGVTLAVKVNDRYGKNVTSAPDGRFQAGGLDEGTITVEIAAWDQNYIRNEPVAVTPGDRAARIVVEPGESISGVMLSAQGTPISQVQIEVLDGEGKQVSQTWAWQEDGTFTVGGLRKGTYTLRASRWTEGKQELLATAEGIATGSIGIELQATE